MGNNRLFSSIRKSPNFRLLIWNTFNFLVFQVTRYLIPMAAIPYILHRIGPENFGIISVAYSSIMIFKVLVDYGFDISGVRLISRLQGDQQKTNNVFSNVFYIRFTIIILLGILLLLSTFFISAVDEHFSIYISTFLMLPGFVLQAIWVYTGAEKNEVHLHH
jgi:O-antigen/teichoic acid export membrane protein